MKIIEGLSVLFPPATRQMRGSTDERTTVEASALIKKKNEGLKLKLAKMQEQIMQDSEWSLQRENDCLKGMLAEMQEQIEEFQKYKDCAAALEREVIDLKISLATEKSKNDHISNELVIFKKRNSLDLNSHEEDAAVEHKSQNNISNKEKRRASDSSALSGAESYKLLTVPNVVEIKMQEPLAPAEPTRDMHKITSTTLMAACPRRVYIEKHGLVKRQAKHAKRYPSIKLDSSKPLPWNPSQLALMVKSSSMVELSSVHGTGFNESCETSEACQSELSEKDHTPVDGEWGQYL